MGIPLKRKSVAAMWKRWERDLERLEALFGEYDENDYSDGAEMQRNLATAISYANGFMTASAKKIE